MKYSAWMPAAPPRCCCCSARCSWSAKARPRSCSTSAGGAHRPQARPALQVAAGRNRAHLRPSPADPGGGTERYLTSEKKDVSVDFSPSAGSPTCAISTAPPTATRRSPPIASRRSSPTRCATRSMRTPCSGGLGDRSKVLADQPGRDQQGRGPPWAADLRHPHQAHRPADRWRGDRAGLPPDARAAPAGEASQLRAEGQETKQKIESRPTARARCCWPRPSATRRSCAAKAMPGGRADLCAGRAARFPLLRLPAQPEAYRQAFAGGDSAIVLERNDPFLQFHAQRPVTLARVRPVGGAVPGRDDRGPVPVRRPGGWKRPPSGCRTCPTSTCAGSAGSS